MALFHDSAIAGASGNQATGYKIERSLRFNSSDSAYLSRTPASAGNRKTWTWSGWVKRGQLLNKQCVFSSGTPDNANNVVILQFSDPTGANGDTINLYTHPVSITTTQVFRDTSAWYHIVWAFDTTQATAANRSRLYVNGTEVTSFSGTYPSQNTDYGVNASGVLNNIGRYTYDGDRYLSGYLADIHFIDGQALDPSSFAETNITTGQWVPKAYTGTYGTNGFRLAFADNSNNTATTLGKDTSGNGNNWTPNNLSVASGSPTSVAEASGALPIYNTTDTYGTVKGSGTRTDSNSSSIVLALPMDGANNGTTFTDESATIKGSGSAKSITRNGDTKTSTTQSKFYGSSGFFDGSGDYLNVGSSSDYLFGTGDFTIESWFYLTSNSGRQDLCGNYSGATTGWGVSFGSVSTGIYFYYGNNVYAQTSSNIWPVNRWNHVAIVRSSSVLRIYLNGVQVSSETMAVNISTTSYSTLVGAVTDYAGNPQLLINGYLQDFRIYKGVAKYTSNFNPPSSTQNPTVAAGNDSLVDTPTSYGTDTGAGGEVRGNYCTLNPLDERRIGSSSNGNLDIVNVSQGVGSINTPSTGKWYWEASIVGTGLFVVGIIESNKSSVSISYFSNGNKRVNGSDSAYGSSFSNGDVIGVGVNCDSSQVTFYKNGVSQGAIAFSSGMNGNVTSVTYVNSSGELISHNFGQRQWAYQAPAGFKALCDTNLPAPVVAKPSTVMDVKLYTGNDSTQTISGLGFSPDLVWIKARSNSFYHRLYDTIRGTTKALYSNTTETEGLYQSSYENLTAFNSDGFSLGSTSLENGINKNGSTFAAWCWDAGSSTVTNTQGSITSQVRANASAGFSIVTYTGNGVLGATVGHGLNVPPQFVITKSRNLGGGNYAWGVFHKSLGGTKALKLNATEAATTALQYWNNTDPSSTVFTIGNLDETNNGSATYVAYCFAPVAGYSSFGSYTGNGSTDGPFVYTGFRPRWILFKNSSAVQGWCLVDTARSTFNLVDAYLQAHASAAEASGFAKLDIVSNGFKVRDSDAFINGNTNNIIYGAFAESPLQYARAR